MCIVTLPNLDEMLHTEHFRYKKKSKPRDACDRTFLQNPKSTIMRIKGSETKRFMDDTKPPGI